MVKTKAAVLFQEEGVIMMSDALIRDDIKYLVARLLDNANEAVKESNENTDDQFAAGRCLAYYEMLDILKTELDIRD